MTTIRFLTEGQMNRAAIVRARTGLSWVELGRLFPSRRARLKQERS